VTRLLRKYDVVSLQPMNEPALQSICDLLSNHDASSSARSNVHFVDIIVLEYATGSRGGYGLSYKLRKEYVEKALRAGVTFELWRVSVIPVYVEFDVLRVPDLHARSCRLRFFFDLIHPSLATERPC
jgi:hypothetical protein